MKKSKGFTLIELMVVVVILGILAVVVAPRIPDLVKKAQEGATKGALATMRSTLNIYYSDQEGSYPITSANTTVTNEINDILVPKYIKKIPDIRIPTAYPGITISGVYGYPSIPTTSDSVRNDGIDAWGYCGQPTISVGGQTTANPDYGNIIVNCGHRDTKGNLWLSY